MKSNVLLTIAGLLTFALSSASAVAASAESHDVGKLIQANAEQKRVSDASKYDQIVAMAGDKKDELEMRKNEASTAYKYWHDLKSAIETPPSNPSVAEFKALTLASHKYSDANKAFLDLQKEILSSQISAKDQPAHLVSAQ